MAIRRATSLVILGAFLALAVLSFLGNRVLGVLFIAAAGAVLTHHAIRLCPRCSNLACAFNPGFSRSRTQAPESAARDAYSNLPITRTTVIPLLLFGPLAFIGALQYSPPATVAVAIVALTAHTVFRRITCSHCGNDCAGNCNSQYKQWKRSQLDARV